MLQAIGTPCMALGLTDIKKFIERLSLHPLTLRHGDWLVQCSDGIIEVQKSEDNLPGLARYAGATLFRVR